MSDDTHCHRVTLDEMTLDEQVSFIAELRRRRETLDIATRAIRGKIDTMKHGPIRSAHDRQLAKLMRVIEKVDKYLTEAYAMLEDVFGMKV